MQPARNMVITHPHVYVHNAKGYLFYKTKLSSESSFFSCRWNFYDDLPTKCADQNDMNTFSNPNVCTVSTGSISFD